MSGETMLANNQDKWKNEVIQPAIPARPTGSSPDVVSIVVTCCGQLEFTKLCVPSILRYGRNPFELVFLDIGSLDGTTEYLAGIAAASNVPVEVIQSTSDSGIGDACKDAIARARGEYLILLNNDTLVTEGWLNQLIGLASLSSTIGMVGPMSNYAAPPQLVDNVPYRIGPKKVHREVRTRLRGSFPLDVEPVNRFAQEWREKNRGKWFEVKRLDGFCLLLKRKVLDVIGPPAGWNSLGVFDTDALSFKACQAGFTLACCRDLFIHHFGTRTFAEGGPDVNPCA